DHYRRGPPEHAPDPARRAGGRLGQELAAREPGRAAELQRDAQAGRRPPRRGGRQGATGDDALAEAEEGLAMAGDHVRIFDTTLRDGEQSPGATLNVDE